MCRSIKPLFNFDPPTNNDEVKAAALQFVRKVSGYREPSRANKQAFDEAVQQIAQVTQVLLKSLSTTAPPRVR